jgi:hypothetical protein
MILGERNMKSRAYKGEKSPERALFFCVHKQSQVALTSHRACTRGWARTFGEQHDRETEGFAGGVCLWSRAK